jgi:hypothetical protein
MTKKKSDSDASVAGISRFVDEFKEESDRAAVILGAAKIDSILAQILDRYMLASLSSSDELLDGDSPLATFSARINTCYRLGLIDPDFAKALHLTRKIRNSFAHEVSGVSLESGAHADRINSLLLPLRSLPYFIKFRDLFFGEQSTSNDFRSCLAMMIARLTGRLNHTPPPWIRRTLGFHNGLLV